MRNAKVFIILIGRSNLTTYGEEGQSALGLYKKYNGRSVNGITQQVELISVKKAKGPDWQTVDSALTPSTAGQITLADGDRVGFYLVGHKQDYETHKPVKIMLDVIEKRVKAAAKVEDATDGKKSKARPIAVTIDKVCLVLCDSAARVTNTSLDNTVKTKDDPIDVKGVDESNASFKKRLQADTKQFGLETSLLADLCRRLAEEGHRPRLAGYTGAITAIGPRDVNAETGFTGGGYKDKLTVGQKTKNYDETGQKLFFVYDAEQGYMQRDKATWTDKP